MNRNWEGQRGGGRYSIIRNRDLTLRQEVSNLARLYIFNQAKTAFGWLKI
jgi:hypothetical protein